jgi:hypothetical protein
MCYIDGQKNKYSLLGSLKVNSVSSLATTVTASQHHWTAVVSFGDSTEEQIPTSNISKATEYVLKEGWLKCPLPTIQNLYSPFQEGTLLSWRLKLAQHYAQYLHSVRYFVQPL